MTGATSRGRSLTWRIVLPMGAFAALVRFLP